VFLWWNTKAIIIPCRECLTKLRQHQTEQPRAVRVNVTLPEDVLEQIDRYAEAHGFTRSGLLAQAAKKLMAGAA
jgi:hypothetical protein